MKTKLIRLVVLASLAGFLMSCATTSQFTPGSCQVSIECVEAGHPNTEKYQA